jgi:hypothetical protein
MRSKRAARPALLLTLLLSALALVSGAVSTSRAQSGAGAPPAGTAGPGAAASADRVPKSRRSASSRRPTPAASATTAARDAGAEAAPGPGAGLAAGGSSAGRGAATGPGASSAGAGAGTAAPGAGAGSGAGTPGAAGAATSGTGSTTANGLPPASSANPGASGSCVHTVFPEVQWAARTDATSKPQAPPGRPDEVELGNVIVLYVPKLPDLLKELRAEACKSKQLVLYLDGRPLKDVAAFPPDDPREPYIRFSLKRTETSREVWTYLLGRPQWNREVEVSAGLADEFAFSTAAKVMLEVIPEGRLLFWSLLFLVILGAFMVLTIRSNLLRDSQPSLGPGTRPPFSLARTQAAWWFFLVLMSYLFIGLITGDFSSSITGTVLTLVGISAGTMVGSAVVDTSREGLADRALQVGVAQQLSARLAQIDQELQAASNAVVAAPQDAAAAARLQALIAERAQRSSELKKARNQSENLLLDILSDASGVSFHRFQIAAWSLVLGVIFLYQVYRELAMPNFDASLLALMGISSGTYLGMKLPEPRVPGQTAGAPVAPGPPPALPAVPPPPPPPAQPPTV